MLLAAARQESCEGDVWGYDGKRRYRLTCAICRQSGVNALRWCGPMQPEVTGYVYACELTMYAEGRQARRRERLSHRLWPASLLLCGRSTMAIGE